jgi:hypothetical protein
MGTKFQSEDVKGRDHLTDLIIGGRFFLIYLEINM